MKMQKSVYEIRRSGVTICASTVPMLGYPSETISQMQKNGLHLYMDGRRVKKPLPVVDVIHIAHFTMIDTCLSRKVKICFNQCLLHLVFLNYV